MVSFDIAEGNPGTFSFITQAYEKFLHKAERAFQRMQDANITGTKLYMLWNDCCNRDTEKAIDIMIGNDIDDIISHINYENGRGIPFAEKG